MRFSHIFAAIFLLFSIHLGAEELPRIEVSGTAIIEVEPDIIRWNLQVQQIRQSAADAASRMNEATKTVMRILQSNGIADADIQTTHLQLSENWRYSKLSSGSNRVRDGFVASVNVGFKQRNFRGYEAIWSQLTEIEGVLVQSTSFSISNRNELKKEAQQMAVEAARGKAMRMLEPLDERPGRTLLLAEQIQPLHMSNNLRNVVAEADFSGAGAEGSSLATGKIEVAVTVNAAFEILPNK